VQSGADVTALALYNAFDSCGWLDDLPAETRARLRIVRGDVRDSHLVMRLLEGQEVAFHLAALIAIPHSYQAPASYVDVNITGTLNVLEAAKAHRLRRIIHTSTSEVYGTAITTPITEEHMLQGQSPYAATKIAADMMAEAFARSFDLPVVILRPFNTFGPRQSERAVLSSAIRQALDPACPEIRVGDLTPRRDFTYVDETADAFIRVGAADGLAWGETYNGGTGRAVAIGEAVDIVRRVTGTNKPVVSDAARLRPTNSEVRELLADHGKLTRATGWAPRISLEEGIGRTIDWWRARVQRGTVRRDASYVS
jgi:UDP-glucose 4-epimerase